ncbi:MAG: glycosyltransferase family 4 protein [Tatlockia sp.]|nr:glycosyltransferase family 4 protein [Tatlockia sp.]
MSNALKTIAVDLTPVLPGGENGGAKIFVLELLSRLARLAPETQFIFLTQALSHSELKAMERKNISCVMVLGRAEKPRPLFAQLQTLLRKIPYFGRKFNTLIYRIVSLVKRRKASSLLCKLNANLLFCPFTAPTYFEPGIPTVCTIYDLQYKTYPEFFSEEERIQRNRTFTEACRNASMLTAISEYSRQSAIKHGKINPEKIRTIHLRMAHRILPKAVEDKSILNRLNLSAQPYLLYPANFWKHKNHEMLLTAFAIACQKNLASNIKLVCTGAVGSRQVWLAKAATMMNLGERIIFPGFITNGELALLMTNSRAVIFPSLYEGFGLPIIEAMAAGVPVACSNLCALPEIAGDAALNFNPRIPLQIADAILALCTDEELRTRLINAGKERAKLFSDSSHMAEEYWHLFHQALGLEIQEDEPLWRHELTNAPQNNGESSEFISTKNSA